MRYARVARLIARIFLLLLASTMSLVSFLGGYSALLILGDEKNIDLNVDMTGNMLNTNDTTFELKIGFKFDNKGYFDLEDLKIELELSMVYEYFNYSGDGKNKPIGVSLYEGKKTFKTVENGEKLKGSISIERADLEITDAIASDIYNHIDPRKDIIFMGDRIAISGKYSLGLISFNVEIEDYEIESFKIS